MTLYQPGMDDAAARLDGISSVEPVVQQFHRGFDDALVAARHGGQGNDPMLSLSPNWARRSVEGATSAPLSLHDHLYKAYTAFSDVLGEIRHRLTRSRAENPGKTQRIWPA